MAEFIPPAPEELDASFPNYEITSFIAQGGMGAVYLGNQISLDRPVAIKILPPELGNDQSYLASFESEAKSLAKLNHSNLVGIYDFGQVGGMFYIIMEYVPGRSLYYTAHGHAVDEHEASFLISEICKGLAHAHDHGILHRDIKPANILIDDEACPMLVDFGLAKPISDDHHQGVIFGTPGYTAPEVVANPHAVDHKSDIFSVGIMLYELLTGQLPGEPFIPASQLNDTDPRFDEIIQLATHPDPNARYASCSIMAEALDQLVANWEQAPSHHQGQGTKILATAASAGGAVAAPILTAAPGSVAAARAAASAAQRQPSMLHAPTVGYMATPAAAPAAQAHPAVNPAIAAAPPAAKVAAPRPSGPSAGSVIPPSRAMTPKKQGGAGLIITLLLVLGLIIAGIIYLKTDAKNKQIAEQNRLNQEKKEAAEKRAEEEKKAELEKERKRAAREERKKQQEEEKSKQAELDRQQREREAAAEREEEKLKAEQARLKAEEEARLAAEAEKNKGPVNGPNAVEFSPENYIQKGREGITKALHKGKQRLQEDLVRNIRELEDLAMGEVKKLPRKPRAEAKGIVEDLIDDLKTKKKLPGAPPEDAIAAIKTHYGTALEKQEKIEQKFDETIADYHKRYLSGVNAKIEELTKTENFVEIERLKQELTNAGEFANFKALVY